MKTIFSLFSFCIVLIACSKQTEPERLAFPNLSYGPFDRNQMDVYLPPNRDSLTGSVLILHGGGWTSGNKDWGEVKGLRNAILSDEVHSVATINYRYACGDPKKQMNDIDNVIRYIIANAHEWNISDNQFALVGFSAGGHLSLLYGHAFDTLGLIKTVISVSGPTDLTDSLFLEAAENQGLLTSIEQLVGETLGQSQIAYLNASPLYKISNCPTFFVHGAQDSLVPVQNAVNMHDSLMARYIVTDTLITHQGTHNVYGPGNIYKDQVMNEMINWLDLHLHQ